MSSAPQTLMVDESIAQESPAEHLTSTLMEPVVVVEVVGHFALATATKTQAKTKRSENFMMFYF
jgi:hypothetical protein